jgi:excisionase family DNA binding protein
MNYKEINREVLFVEEIAAILGISRSKAYEWVNEIFISEHPPFRIIKCGRCIRIPAQSFHDWMIATKNIILKVAI